MNNFQTYLNDSSISYSQAQVNKGFSLLDVLWKPSLHF